MDKILRILANMYVNFVTIQARHVIIVCIEPYRIRITIVFTRYISFVKDSCSFMVISHIVNLLKARFEYDSFIYLYQILLIENSILLN